MKTEVESIFVSGAISPQFIGDRIANSTSETRIGAHDIFLGQVRADVIKGNMVSAIEYSAYEGMANQKFEELRKAAFEEFDLNAIVIHHSLGKVNVGEICLFVMVSAPHRKEVFKALQNVVEAIKKEVPVFGKELFQDDSYQWKVNT